MAFTQKAIEVTVILGSGSFAGGGNTKIINGLATKASVEKVGLPDKNKANIEITGLKIEDMEQMTTLAFLPLEKQKNLVQIKAGELDGELSQIFAGEIATASADFNSSPNIIFTIEALAGYFPALKAVPATSSKGSTDTPGLLAKLTGQAGYTFKNEGVSGSMLNPYYVGNPIEQMRQIAKDNNFQLIIDDNEVIALPKDKTRSGSTEVLSKDSGLIGYPTFTGDGISCRCYFTPSLQLGGMVEIESIVPKASGKWKITKLNHDLTAFTTGENPWETSFEGVPA